MKSSALANFAKLQGFDVVMNSQGDKVEREAYVYRFKRFNGSVLYKMHTAKGFDSCIKYIVINVDVNDTQYYKCTVQFSIDNCPNFADAEWQRDLFKAVHLMKHHNDPSYVQALGKEFAYIALLNVIDFTPHHAPRPPSRYLYA